MDISNLNKELKKILDNLVENTGSISASLITEDGYIITTNSNLNEEIEEKNTNFAAISASILSMAERGIEIINKNKILEQIKIDAGLSDNLEQDFTILITRVVSNVLLQVIFPKRINIGLIQFESNIAIRFINDIIKKDVNREIFSNINTLL
ncbi:MAG: roadblock/LC7 domain-containing protein [Promethearchaeota archaeon]